ncbi:coiled-coil domain-containing protein 186 isoform X3 [Bombus terrestris]|uniref:Coiled-coil domain-containing protein 186 isoform X3 n=1 Tax=Bombus terrestris TaxID=30195 RepID=A0A9B2MT91_BOMTE|nr:coiled-coil domain-containing protein 186 isoform X3 [Bombus terrestris]
MEFTVGEMEGTKLELSFQDKILSENVNQADSSVKSDVSIAEDINLIIQQDIKIHEETMPIHEELVQDSTDEIRGDSVLVKNSDEKKYQLIERNNIDTTVKSSTSLSNFTNTISNHNVRSISPNTICNDEEEIIFNTKLYMEEHETKSLKNIVGVDTHENCEVKENIGETEEEVYHSNANGKLLVNNGQAPRNLVKYEKNFNEEQKLCAIIKDTKIQSNVISRPTLVDDSRLVKISLPTNPINIMQSNAQFLNKSRNFLNFITEKSTNIMEKALLPQHIAMRYNSVMKSVDNICNEKRYTEESSGMESSLTGLAFNNTSDSFLKTKSISCVTKGQMDVQTVENEYVKNDENKNTFMLSSNETISGNIEQNSKYLITNEYIFDQNNVIDHSSKLKDSKQSESSSIGNNVNKTNDNVLCANTNRNHNLNFVVLNPDNNIEEAITDTIYKKEEVSTDFEESKQSLLQHPIYLTLLKDYADLKSKHLKLQEKVEHLEERNRILEAENKGEVFSVQIETLEKTINRLTLELHTSLEAQEMYKKEYSAANKERESMVMKYAVSEKQLIDTQRAKESAERKVKEMTMQQETLHSKLREMQGERGRICNILTGKHREVIDLQREVEKLKEDVKMRDIKLQWTQNKLKTEMDLQKETQQKLDKATIRINEMKEECEQVRKETQETMRKFQQSEENKAVTLDQQLKEQQARLILERHVTEDKEMLRVQLQKEVDTLKHRQQVLIEENNMLSLKIQDVEKNRLNYESNLNNLKIITDQRQKEITELLSKVSELESLKTQLQHKNQYLASTEVEIQHLRLANEELQADMSACQQKEAEMLDFTQKLTDKNVRLQSEFTAIEAKAKQLEQEHGPLYQRISELIDKVKVLEENLAREKKARIEESEVLERCLTEQTQAAKNLAQQLEDSQGENAVLKRKQQLSMKEMTRELQQCRKKLDAFETSIPYNSLSVASRTGSNISLITGDALNGALSDNSINGDQSIQPTEPSRQLLIDRIIKLQESNARKAEKLDFFEEHARILVEELQKKKKIIQTYILHENIGAMGGNERDKYKHIKSRRNAAELARHGGIMASVYNQRVSDDNMTLELSLEINQKLQAVLEDALFKNITLKDNIDTLGEEIARLTMQNQQRQNTH